MKTNTPELQFPSRSDFRKWLFENANMSNGVWLVAKQKRSLP